MSKLYFIDNNPEQSDFVLCLKKYITMNSGDPDLFPAEPLDIEYSVKRKVFQLSNWPYKDFEPPKTMAQLPLLTEKDFEDDDKKRFAKSFRNNPTFRVIRNLCKFLNKQDSIKPKITLEDLFNKN